MFPNIEGRVIALDFETTGVRWVTDSAFSVAVYMEGAEPFYYDFRRTPSAVAWLQDQLPKVKKWVNHSIKFDANFAMNLGIRLPEVMECTMLRAALIDEHLFSYSLDELAKKYVGVQKDAEIYQELADLFGGRATRSVQMKNLPLAPPEIVGRYAKQDAVVAYKLWEWQEKEIERQGLRKVVDLEHQLLPVVIRMERGGVRIDEARAEKSAKDIDGIVSKEHYELNKLAGFEVNYNPSGSIKRLFDPKMVDGKWVLTDGTIASATDGGAPSIDADCLRRMKHPAAAKILRLRKLTKTRDTFLRGHVLGHSHNGRVYFNVNQTRGDNDAGTGTGRLSINDPALQQIPARDKEIKAIVRPCFLPDEGQKWVAMDWAQMDFRMFAHYTKVPSVLRKFADDPDTDFHQLVADMTGIPRSPRFAGDANAKQINLGMVFGMGQGKLASEMGLPYTVEKGYNDKEYLKPGHEAMEVFEKYHSAVPGVKEFLDRASSVARARGYVMSVMGRHLRFPGGQFLHKAGGYLFQSACAEAMKVKMIEFDEYCLQNGGRQVLTVHDELGLSMPADCSLDEARGLFTRFDGVLTPIKFAVPISADVVIGDSWYEG